MKVQFTWKDAIYVGTLIVGIALYFMGEAKEKATTATVVQDHTEELKEINDKLEKYGDYWLEQNKVNGAIVTALSLDVE